MKNIKPLNGRPLFYFIADTQRDTLLFDSLVINTDSSEIAKLARSRYGSRVQNLDRPQELCGDLVSMNSIIEHEIDIIGDSEDFFQTHSTNPLLRATTISNAVAQYLSERARGEIDSLFAVNAFRSRLYDSHLHPINHDPAILCRTHDLETIYEENSDFYIFSRASFRKSQHRIGLKQKPCVVNRNSLESIDIDESEDWELAELALAHRNRWVYAE